MRYLLISLLGIFFSSVCSAQIYSWKDERGVTVFGDNPPDVSRAREVNPEPLTIIPGYSETPADSGAKSEDKEKKAEDEVEYESFDVAYPTADEAIRANDGNVSVSFKLTPALKPADSIFVYVDGKKLIEDSKSLSVDLNNLDRGSHSLFAVVRNKNGDVLINSNTVSFHVLRNSIIGK